MNLGKMIKREELKNKKYYKKDLRNLLLRSIIVQNKNFRKLEKKNKLIKNISKLLMKLDNRDNFHHLFDFEN